MDSDLALRSLAATGIWGEPYLWASAASSLLGLAAGQAIRALVPAGDGPLRAMRLRPRRAARAIALLSLGILAIAGLFVLSVGGWGDARSLALWAGLLFLLSALAGFRALALGLPLAALVLSAFGLVALCLEGWLPFPAGSGAAPFPVARLLPYEAGPASFRGQLELLERDSMPIVQDAGLAAASCGLCVESLALGGPLGFAAELVAPKRPAAGATLGSGGQRYYRIVGLVAPGGAIQAFAEPPRLRFLDAAVSLPSGLGLEPGGSPAARSGLLGLATRTRASSPSAVLFPLEPVVFALGDDGSASILP